MEIRDETGNLTSDFKEAIAQAIRDGDETITHALNEAIYEYIRTHMRMVDNSDYYGSGKALKIYPPSSDTYSRIDGHEIYSSYESTGY